MKKYSLLPLLAMLMALSSCQLIGDIFKTGLVVWGIGILIVILVVVFLLRKVGGK